MAAKTYTGARIGSRAAGGDAIMGGDAVTMGIADMLTIWQRHPTGAAEALPAALACSWQSASLQVDEAQQQ